MKDKLEFNEENQINLVVEKDGLKREIFYQGKPIQELIKYKDMWQKLKEWLNKEADHVRYTPYDCRSLSSDFELWHLNKILDKMQELEGEKDVED